jgi:flagellar hook-length control protein FliK
VTVEEPGEPAVTGVLLPAAAHLRVSSEALGEITLHLRIHDGAAHVRIEADAGAAVEARAPELARALAAEGIGLARLEVEPRSTPAAPSAPQSGAQGRAGGEAGGRGQDGRPDPEASRAAPAPNPPRTRARRSEHDVTA